MTRSSLLSLFVLGLAACGGVEDEEAVELQLDAGGLEQVLPGSIDRSPPSPAQRLVQVLTGIEVRSAGVGTTLTLRGTEGASSPDPMPGRQAPGACELDFPCEGEDAGKSNNLR